MGRNLKGTVNLFTQHHPGQLMRKCHGRHGNSFLPFSLYLFVKPIGTANHKAQGTFTVHRRFLYGFAQLFGCEFGSFNTQWEQDVVPSGFQQFFCLLPARRLRSKPAKDFRGDGFREFLNRKPAKGRQPFGILVTGIPPIGFFQFSHTQNPYFQHMVPLPPLR